MQEPIYKSESMEAIVEIAEKVANSMASVMILGPSGVGKEVIADVIHNTSTRAKQPLVKVNCAAIPRDLIENELFGSRKGSYTSSISDKEGLFHAAGKGTIMLDEITEMPIETQSKLLRVLQEKTVRPIGGKESHPIFCRVISSTNLPMNKAFAARKLREDLFFRLNVVTISVPPLAKRVDDIPVLAEYFLQKFSFEEGKTGLKFSNSAMQFMMTRPWTGNVRELQGCIHRAVIFADKTIEVEHISQSQPESIQETLIENSLETSVCDDKGVPLTLLENLEKDKMIEVLNALHWNIQRSAKILGLGRQTIYNKMKKYKLYRDGAPTEDEPQEAMVG